jgi:hypothetical protein
LTHPTTFVFGGATSGSAYLFGVYKEISTGRKREFSRCVNVKGQSGAMTCWFGEELAALVADVRVEYICLTVAAG